LPTPQIIADYDIIHSAFITLGRADYSISQVEETSDSNHSNVLYTRDHRSIDFAYSIGKKIGDVTIYSGLYLKQVDIDTQDRTNLTLTDLYLQATHKGGVVGLQVPLNEHLEFGFEFSSYNIELDNVVDTGLTTSTRLCLVF
jgi:hypothetical protein